MLKELKEQKGNKKIKDDQGKKEEQYMISTLFLMINVDIYDS